MAQPRVNLKGAAALLVDNDHFTRGLVAQMFRGFGMDSPSLCDTGEEAKTHLRHHGADLVIIAGGLPDMTGADLTRWIRRQDKATFRFVPIIVASGYTQMHLVSTSRDAGANLVVKKPFAPSSLFDRIVWLARSPRPFVETKTFIGPDRRFKEVTPPDELSKRETDVSHHEDADAPAAERGAA